ncbi:MAG: hypothetical protein M1819_001752 [Sarea resinae]|nr:MAG: hypothetical protein M1819_001752 [Sarea resinae]
MLPTPSTSHVSFENIYEPAEDSYLVLDTLSSPAETAFLHARFGPLSTPTQTTPPPISSPSPSPSPSPLVLEVGTGSGVVLAFLTAHARALFGRPDILTLGTDANAFASRATGQTVRRAVSDASTAAAAKEAETADTVPGPGYAQSGGPGSEPEGRSKSRQGERKRGAGAGAGAGAGLFLSALVGDLVTPLRDGQVDVLVFNPPYVPTDALPALPSPPSPPSSSSSSPTTKTTATTTTTTTTTTTSTTTSTVAPSSSTFETTSHLLSLSYAGGPDAGMLVTRRLLLSLPAVLSPRGVAYVILCAQNKIPDVLAWIRGWGCQDEDDEEVQEKGDDGAGGEEQEDDTVGLGQGKGKREKRRKRKRRSRRWCAESVGKTGGKGGWERLQLIRIWRE